LWIDYTRTTSLIKLEVSRYTKIYANKFTPTDVAVLNMVKWTVTLLPYVLSCIWNEDLQLFTHKDLTD